MKWILIIVQALTLLLVACSPDERTELSTEKLRLNNIKVKTVDGKVSFDQAVLYSQEHMNIIHLRGNSYQIGYQHGKLLAEEIKEGPAVIYADLIDKGVNKHSLKSWLLSKYLDFTIYSKIERAQPVEFLDEIKGIADGANIPYEFILKANLFHEAGINIITQLLKEEIRGFNNKGLAPSACSTFVARGKATRYGNIIIGRNTDFPGVEGWPKNQTIFFIEPANGFKHVRIGTAGILMWAPGMNEKGIVINGHFMMYDDIHPDGYSAAALSSKILSEADSIEKAIDIVRSNPCGGSCAFVVADGKTGDAVVLEISSNNVEIRRLESDHLVVTNIAISDKMKRYDFLEKYSINEGARGRYKRLKQLIDNNFGRIDLKMAAQFMGDHIRYTTGDERIIYGVVAVSDTVNSVIFDASHMQFWVAYGKAPVANNPYKGFKFNEGINRRSDYFIQEELRGYSYSNSKKQEAMGLFNEAHSLYEKDPANFLTIINLLKSASEKDPKESEINRLIAKICIHNGFYKEALVFVNRNNTNKQSLNEKAQNLLLKGIINDLLGNRREALTYYAGIESLAAEKLADPWFKLNTILQIYSNKYKKNKFTVDDLEDQSVFVSFTNESAID